jgi:hypothetical protein
MITKSVRYNRKNRRIKLDLKYGNKLFGEEMNTESSNNYIYMYSPTRHTM